MDRVRDFDLLFDGELRAYTKTDADGIEVKYIGGTASSTAKDLYGSVISTDCQVKMMDKLRTLAQQLSDKNSGLTAFLNHRYNIPEDVLGAFTSATLTTRREDDEEFIDLDIECRVTETNPRAVAAWDQVKDGIRHGWSIGAIFLDAKWASDDPDSEDFWTLLVTDIDLLEISLVGIPANQRAWCRSSADLKEMAVAQAEQIAREAKENAESAGKRYAIEGEAVRRPDVQRSLALRSLTHQLEVATTTTTSPLIARSETVQLELPESGEPVPTQREGEPAELAAALLASFDATLHVQAAAALNTLSRALEVIRAVQGRNAESKPIAEDHLCMAISHASKAVGHGLCVRDAKHIGAAIECISAAIGGNVVDQPGPSGEADPDEALTFELKKLEPKEGDVIIVLAEDAGALAALQAALSESPFAKQMIFSTKGIEATIDGELTEKLTRFSELQTSIASLEEKNAQLTGLDEQIAARKTELDDVEKRITTLKAERTGRMSDMKAVIADRASSAVKPEHYNLTATEQREAIVRNFGGDGPPEARDLAGQV